jgi:alpha-tubulin suppressor-like RCC1 family protein
MLAWSVLLAACAREVQVLVPPVDAGLPAGGSALAVSSWNSCRIGAGVLHCWGANDRGQLALPPSAPVLTPHRVDEATDWVRVGLGEAHACALRADGRLYCWGANDQGQLGVGDLIDRATPTQLAGGPWLVVAVGQEHTCAIDVAHGLYCWGQNHEGQTGVGGPFGEPDVLLPRAIAMDQRFVDVSAGDGHTCAVREDGTVWCVGRNGDGQLATGSPFPGQIRELTAAVGQGTFVKIDVSQHHGCALTLDGALHCWGLDTHGELGQGLAPESGMVLSVPTRVGDRNDWIGIDAHWFHTCALAEDRAMHCFGRNAEGQLGDGTIDPTGLPREVPDGLRALRIAVGRFHTCAELVGGEVRCWGDNRFGQLGTGDLERRSRPTPVAW